MINYSENERKRIVTQCQALHEHRSIQLAEHYEGPVYVVEELYLADLPELHLERYCKQYREEVRDMAARDPGGKRQAPMDGPSFKALVISRDNPTMGFDAERSVRRVEADGKDDLIVTAEFQLIAVQLLDDDATYALEYRMFVSAELELGVED